MEMYMQFSANFLWHIYKRLFANKIKTNNSKITPSQSGIKLQNFNLKSEQKLIDWKKFGGPFLCQQGFFSWQEQLKRSSNLGEMFEIESSNLLETNFCLFLLQVKSSEKNINLQ